MTTYDASTVLYEVLKSTSRMEELNLEDFLITPPTAVGVGTATRITLTPYEHSQYYAIPTITYNRFDLSVVDPLVISRATVSNTHDIVQAFSAKRLFKYFIWDESHSNLLSRFLHLRERDFDNILLPAITVTTPYELIPKQDSELFAGKLRVTLTP